MRDARDDLVPDPIAYRDFRLHRSKILADVRSRLAAGYQPSQLLRMDVPKGDFLLRPATTPEIEDRLVYTALIGTFAHHVDSLLEPEEIVPSNRVRPGRTQDLFKFGLNQWFEFQKLPLSGLSDGYDYMLVTDLVGYFDHIQHVQLLDQLRDAGIPDNVCALLRTILRHWSEGTPIGIPQGPDPSFLLGGFYLNPVDKFMVRSGYRYFRYVDDIRIMAKSEPEIKRAATDLVRQARLLGLHLQSAKTRLYVGNDIKSLVTSRDAELGAIDYHMRMRYHGKALEEVDRVLNDILSEPQFNERHFRKCVNTLRKLRSPLAVSATLERLDALVGRANTICDYLREFITSEDSIAEELISYLSDPDRNVYEWPEFWIANTLIDAKVLPREFLNWCRSRVQEQGCHWNVRAQYALILGKHGDLTDRRLIRQLVASRENEYERRGFIVALSQLPQPEKGAVIKRYRLEYPHLAPAIQLAA